MVNLRRAIVVAATVLLLAGTIDVFRAGALPRYSARYGQRCALCHTNPSGGGLRTTYASQQLVPEEIAWPAPKEGRLPVPDPQITPSVLVGADFRHVYVGSGDRAHNLDFFQMQGDFYLAFQLEPRVLLYYDRGMSSARELFGVAYVLPLTGYVKAGRFVPSYGWKFDDHTMFVRDALGLAPPANSDAGVEIGFQPGPFDVQLGLLNGSRGTALDTDNRLAQSANAIFRGNMAGVGFGVGAAGYHRSGAVSDLDVGGGHGYLTWRGITWLGEVDAARTDVDGMGRVTALVTSHELSVVAHQGLELTATYDFFDPDRHVKSGAKSRWGLGAHLMARPYVVIGASFRRTTFDDGSVLSGDDFDETVLQLHLAY